MEVLFDGCLSIRVGFKPFVVTVMDGSLPCSDPVADVWGRAGEHSVQWHFKCSRQVASSFEFVKRSGDSRRLESFLFLLNGRLGFVHMTVAEIPCDVSMMMKKTDEFGGPTIPAVFGGKVMAPL